MARRPQPSRQSPRRRNRRRVPPSSQRGVVTRPLTFAISAPRGAREAQQLRRLRERALEGDCCAAVCLHVLSVHPVRPSLTPSRGKGGRPRVLPQDGMPLIMHDDRSRYAGRPNISAMARAHGVSPATMRKEPSGSSSVRSGAGALDDIAPAPPPGTNPLAETMESAREFVPFDRI
jgi:hypothetical protein